MHSAKLIQVIVTESCRGEGVEGDVCRTVYEYWSTDGQRLAEHDTYPSEPKPVPTGDPRDRALGRQEGIAAVTVALGAMAPAAEWARSAREWLMSAEGRAAVEVQLQRLSEKLP